MVACPCRDCQTRRAEGGAGTSRAGSILDKMKSGMIYFFKKAGIVSIRYVHERRKDDDEHLMGGGGRPRGYVGRRTVGIWC